MSSIAPSPSSSTPGSLGLPRRVGHQGLYLGPEYLRALEEPPDPLVHADPFSPTRPYELLMAFIRLLLRWFFRAQVVGLENIPSAPFIIAANHLTWFDTLFIAAVFPRRPMVYTMARRDTVFNRGWKRWLVRRFGVFPVQPRRGRLDERAAATVYQLLAQGGVVLIFPEGRYSRGRALKPLKKGVGHFALNAGVPICPVAISGLDRLRPFGRIELTIGPPIWPDPPGWWSLNRRVTTVMESVRRAILHSFQPDGTAPARPRGRRRPLHLPRRPWRRAALPP
ncbi:MAG: 1-acyl-sn-glycerol-3-phosphate acyltransferase [Candidatus Dormibacteraeota bacterium]|nr:1-acyl-sn-glycerol-3-phosphate acyltransferase [Candidatus Dormibacteraeota bacterium]